MPRRIILKRDEIYRRRANAWALHYEYRGLVEAMIKMGFSAEHVIADLKYYYPRPEIGIDGYLLDYPVRVHDFNRRVPENLRVVWYWGMTEWMEFVRLYQALPEVYEDYYYQSNGGRVALAPMSSRPKLGSKKVQLPDFPRNGNFATVDNSVDNLGTSTSKKVQVLSNRQ